MGSSMEPAAGVRMNRKLVEARKAIGLSQYEVARRAKISRTHYAQIELGGKRPSGTVMLGIARVLGQPAEVLFADLVPDGQPAASGE